MSMITATTWVPRGFAAAFPTKYEFDEDEYARIATLAKLQLEDAEEDLAEARAEEASKTEARTEAKAEAGASAPKPDKECVFV
jgi:periodic tryptophan protein 1